VLSYMQGDEFHQSFAFDLMLITWAAKPMRTVITESLDMLGSVGGTPAWVLNNHDTQRIVTRLGRLNASDPAAFTGNNLLYVDAPIDLELGRRRARAAITLTAALPGALYMYQGEEIGLAEYLDMPDAAREDPLFIRTNGEQLGRDGCRVPLPWTSDPSTNFGFSPGPVEPWLPQPADWGEHSVEREAADPNSMLSWYRTLLAHRPLLSGDPSGSTSTYRSAWPSSATGPWSSPTWARSRSSCRKPSSPGAPSSWLPSRMRRRRRSPPTPASGYHPPTEVSSTSIERWRSN